MALEVRPLRFVRGDRLVELGTVEPNRTPLDWFADAPAPRGPAPAVLKEGCAVGNT
jgi:xanthine dehydrogenase iron-sulfur cluster and FAD-binding subunit A